MQDLKNSSKSKTQDNEGCSYSEESNLIRTLSKAELEELVFRYYCELREKRKRGTELASELEDMKNHLEFLKKSNHILIAELKALHTEKRETESAWCEQKKKIKTLEKTLGNVLGGRPGERDALKLALTVGELVSGLRQEIQNNKAEMEALKNENFSLREESTKRKVEVKSRRRTQVQTIRNRNDNEGIKKAFIEDLKLKNEELVQKLEHLQLKLDEKTHNQLADNGESPNVYETVMLSVRHSLEKIYKEFMLEFSRSRDGDQSVYSLNSPTFANIEKSLNHLIKRLHTKTEPPKEKEEKPAGFSLLKYISLKVSKSPTPRIRSRQLL